MLEGIRSRGANKPTTKRENVMENLQNTKKQEQVTFV